MSGIRVNYKLVWRFGWHSSVIAASIPLDIGQIPAMPYFEGGHMRLVMRFEMEEHAIPSDAAVENSVRYRDLELRKRTNGVNERDSEADLLAQS